MGTTHVSAGEQCLGSTARGHCSLHSPFTDTAESHCCSCAANERGLGVEMTGDDVIRGRGQCNSHQQQQQQQTAAPLHSSVSFS